MRLDKIVPIIIGVGFVLIVCWFIFVGFMTYKSVNLIEEQGLKGVVEQIWCGKDETCRVSK